MSTTAPTAAASEQQRRAQIDVTEAATDEVREFAHDVDGPLHLERRGGRTYLVAHDGR